jgi:hypothetical protein
MLGLALTLRVATLNRASCNLARDCRARGSLMGRLGQRPGRELAGADSAGELVAVEKLVDRAVGLDVEVIDLVSADR